MERELAELSARQDASAEAPAGCSSAEGRLARVAALQEQELTQALERQRKLRVQRLRAALARMDADAFGWCDACGARISRGRLEADPTAGLCIACAARRERHP